jgi:hypothetical protein
MIYVPSCCAGMRNFEIRSESLFKVIPTKCKLRLRIVCLIYMFQRRMKLFYKKVFRCEEHLYKRLRWSVRPSVRPSVPHDARLRGKLVTSRLRFEKRKRKLITSRFHYVAIPSHLGIRRSPCFDTTERKLITFFNYQNQKINKKIIKQKRFLNLNKIQANFLCLKPDATGTFRVRL